MVASRSCCLCQSPRSWLVGEGALRVHTASFAFWSPWSSWTRPRKSGAADPRSPPRGASASRGSPRRARRRTIARRVGRSLSSIVEVSTLIRILPRSGWCWRGAPRPRPTRPSFTSNSGSRERVLLSDEPSGHPPGAPEPQDSRRDRLSAQRHSSPRSRRRSHRGRYQGGWRAAPGGSRTAGPARRRSTVPNAFGRSGSTPAATSTAGRRRRARGCRGARQRPEPAQRSDSPVAHLVGRVPWLRVCYGKRMWV